jgi:hypothetical protein
MTAKLEAPFRMGVDIGGTFTDLVVADSLGRLFASKAASRPSDARAGAIDAIEGAAHEPGFETGALLNRCEILVHGSTMRSAKPWSTNERIRERVGPPSTCSDSLGESQRDIAEMLELLTWNKSP